MSRGAAEPSQADPAVAEALDEALRLARRGQFQVEPNPAVGAVVVRDGRIVGRGHHGHYGGPHAEVAALAEAGAAARGATLVVTLEPCCTQGKTPPCVGAILAAGVARVVIGARDPNPRQRGGGARALGGAGVPVLGAEEAVPGGAAQAAAARRLLERFTRHLRAERPYVVAKWAMTADGKVASRSGTSRWISSEPARARVHELRGRVDGIAVGAGTVLADDPLLTARPAGALRAARIVFDRMLRTPPAWRALADREGPQTLLVHSALAAAERRRALAGAGALLLEVEAAAADAFLARALALLRERGIERLLVEGGPTLLGALFDAGAVDQVQVFVAPLLLGGREAPAAVAGVGAERPGAGPLLDEAVWSTLGGDALLEAFVRQAAGATG